MAEQGGGDAPKRVVDVPREVRDVESPGGELAAQVALNIESMRLREEAKGAGWLGRDWLVVGVCVRCGSPIYAVGVWSDKSSPPSSHHSCGCFLSDTAGTRALFEQQAEAAKKLEGGGDAGRES